MIHKENFEQVLLSLGFTPANNGGGQYSKDFGSDCTLKVDFHQKKLFYPQNTIKNPNPKATDSKLQPNGIIIHDLTTCNFSHPENFVVFECVHRLLAKGYKPQHIELEPKWQLGREAKGGKADILVRDNQGDSYLLIECKTTDSKNSEFKKEWAKMQQNGGQLFSYYRQDKNTKFLCLYTSTFTDKLSYENYILNMQDNETYLQKHDFKESYKTANNEEEIFKVWNEIYKQDFSQIGIFEKNINAYEIGKNALCFEDLKELQSTREDSNKKHEDGKYHEFAKILRKYNISGKENAFDKLVNLFLCKIYDETYNKTNLHFIYKGVIADSFEEMQDRLMLLYKNAMKEFLKEEITFIADEDIEKSFNHHSKNEKTLKKEMKHFIKQLKFYSNNDFAFLEVHNEELFYQNAQVLKSVVKLFENLKLTQNQTNQFLGNLFELFLQKGMKQDEGQFFTPVQICEFIIYSLPLEKLYSHKIPRVLDYACGAGHFLNTYANFLRTFIPQEKLQDYYKNIYGIEKEYRLSKVAKVSSCMYGQNEVTILYADALSSDTLANATQGKVKIANNSFDVLITNPPYSVQGFLETLDKKSRDAYRLFGENLNLESNNAIECFFIERANQLLDDEAKVAMILPSSILNKSGIYKSAREILLKNFELIALVELGSQTFGATGTNTIILFASKRQTYHQKDFSKKFHDLRDRLDSESLQDNPNFKDNGYFSSYCASQNYQRQDFLAFLSGQIPQALKEHSHFKEYQHAFKQSNAFKKLKTSKDYEASNEKEKLENKAFLDFAQDIEKDKLLYFALAMQNKVLIIKSPQDNKDQKKFLGYEWSNRKGDEGIKELSSPYATPLFERDNPDNPNKLNFLIQQAFLGESLSIPESLSPYANYAKLVDMLDFSRVEFNKAISLNPSVILSGHSERSEESSRNLDANPFKNSKYELVRLGEIILENPKSKVKVSEAKENTKGKYPFYTSGLNIYRYDEALTSGENIYLSTGGNAIVQFYNGESAYSTDTYVIKSQDSKKALTKFIFYMLEIQTSYINDFLFKGAGLKHLQKPEFRNLKIPLPPLEIQQQIVSECEKVEEQHSTIAKTIETYQRLIKAVLVKCGICHSEALAEESLNNPNRDISHFSNAQYDNVETRHSEALAEESNPFGHSEQSEESLNNLNRDISHFSNAQYDNTLRHSEQSEESKSEESLTPINAFIIELLANITELESKLDWSLILSCQASHYEAQESHSLNCHSEALAEESNPFGHSEQSEESNKDISHFSNAQYDNVETRHSEALAEESNPARHSEALAEESQNLETQKSLRDTSGIALSMTMKSQHDNEYSNAESQQDIEKLKALLASLPTPPKTGWERVKLSKYIVSSGGNGFPKEYQGNKDSTQIPFIKVLDMNSKENSKLINVSNNYVTQEVINKLSLKIFPKNTIVFPKVGMAIHTNKKRMLNIPCVVDNNIMGVNILDKKTNELNYNFLFIVFNFYINLKDIASGANPPSINNTNLNHLQIPLPPLESQEKIVSVIENIESKITSLDAELENLEKQKAIILSDSLSNERERERERDDSKLKLILTKIALCLSRKAFWQNAKSLALEKSGISLNLFALLPTLPTPPKTGWERVRLSDSEKFSLSIGKRVLDSELNPHGKIPVYSANVCKPFGFVDKEILQDYQNDNVLWGIDGDWMVSFMPKNTPFYPTDHCGILVAYEAKAKLVAYILEEEGRKARFSRTLRASIERIKALSLALPPLESQEKIVSVVENIESKITSLDSKLKALENQKSTILKRHLQAQ
ncbi:restriction endonuclease subunit S [Helicobacter himalayensis]|uniref:restriction endonuclease subunit S n=1 Tax=Helicobacter himalayensis TaxID=1591088 RepID=UPI003D6E67B2